MLKLKNMNQGFHAYFLYCINYVHIIYVKDKRSGGGLWDQTIQRSVFRKQRKTKQNKCATSPQSEGERGQGRELQQFDEEAPGEGTASGATTRKAPGEGTASGATTRKAPG